MYPYFGCATENSAHKKLGNTWDEEDSVIFVFQLSTELWELSHSLGETRDSHYWGDTSQEVAGTPHRKRRGHLARRGGDTSQEAVGTPCRKQWVQWLMFKGRVPHRRLDASIVSGWPTNYLLKNNYLNNTLTHDNYLNVSDWAATWNGYKKHLSWSWHPHTVSTVWVLAAGS